MNTCCMQPCDRLPLAFRERCTEKLEHLGDAAAGTKQLDEAVIQYSAALSFNLPVPHVFIKRSKVYLAKGLWQDALHDARQVSPPWLGWVVLVDAEALGNSRSIISMELRERVDGVGKSRFDEWVVEGSTGCRS